MCEVPAIAVQPLVDGEKAGAGQRVNEPPTDKLLRCCTLRSVASFTKFGYCGDLVGAAGMAQLEHRRCRRRDRTRMETAAARFTRKVPAGLRCLPIVCGENEGKNLGVPRSAGATVISGTPSR